MAQPVNDLGCGIAALRFAVKILKNSPRFSFPGLDNEGQDLSSRPNPFS
jgi:hypothetical protein